MTTHEIKDEDGNLMGKMIMGADAISDHFDGVRKEMQAEIDDMVKNITPLCGDISPYMDEVYTDEYEFMGKKIAVSFMASDNQALRDATTRRTDGGGGRCDGWDYLIGIQVKGVNGRCMIRGHWHPNMATDHAGRTYNLSTLGKMLTSTLLNASDGNGPAFYFFNSVVKEMACEMNQMDVLRVLD